MVRNPWKQLVAAGVVSAFGVSAAAADVLTRPVDKVGGNSVEQAGKKKQGPIVEVAPTKKGKKDKKPPKPIVEVKPPPKKPKK